MLSTILRLTAAVALVTLGIVLLAGRGVRADSPIFTDPDGDAALAALVEELGWPAASFCSVTPPGDEPCVAVRSTASATRGIATFGVFIPRGGGFSVVMGRDAAGTWHAWFGTQQQSARALDLPRDVLACGGPLPISLRATPDPTGDVTGEVLPGEALTVEEFVLTTPGALLRPGPRGEGWYRVSAPVAGWVHADLTAVPEFNTCEY